MVRSRDGNGVGGAAVGNAGQELIDSRSSLILSGKGKSEDGVAPLVLDYQGVSHAGKGLVLEVGKVEVQRLAEEGQGRSDEVGTAACGTVTELGARARATGKGPVESGQLHSLLLKDPVGVAIVEVAEVDVSAM